VRIFVTEAVHASRESGGWRVMYFGRTNGTGRLFRDPFVLPVGADIIGTEF